MGFVHGYMSTHLSRSTTSMHSTTYYPPPPTTLHHLCTPPPMPPQPTHTQLTFVALYEFLEASAREVLHCPRCSHTVTAAHGVCSYCHENAYQCRECRYINYAQPDALLCTECGHSRYGRFDVSILCGAPTAGIPSVADRQEYERLLRALGMICCCYCGGGVLAMLYMALFCHSSKYTSNHPFSLRLANTASPQPPHSPPHRP